MSFLWLLGEVSLKAGIVVLLCALLSALVRNRSAVLENRLWRLCLIAAAFIPVCTAIGRSLPNPAPENATRAPGITVKLERSVPSLAITVPSPSEVQASEKATPSRDWNLVAAYIYAIGLVAFLLWPIVGLFRMRRMLGNSTQVHLALEGLPVRNAVRTTQELNTPATIGLRNPVILLPESALAWPGNTLAAALIHEATHIRRQDWSWQLAGQLIRAAMWFNPAAWLLAGGLRQSAERACDDQVVASGLAPTAYARELMEIMARVGRSPELVVPIVRPGSIRRRLSRILMPNYAKRRDGFLLKLAVPGAFVLISLLSGAMAVAVSHSVQSHEAFFGPYRLNGGQVASIVGVSDRLEHWSPNGVQSDRILYFSYPNSPLINEHIGIRAIHLQVSGHLAEGSIFFRPSSARDGVQVSAVHVGNQETDSVVYFKPTLGTKEVNLVVGFGSQPFRLFSDTGPVDPGLGLKFVMNRSDRAGFHARAPWPNLSIQLYLPDAIRDKTLRMAVVTKGGKTFYDGGDWVGPCGPSTADVLPSLRRFHFPSLRSTDIARVRLFARDIEWVTFKGIHLEPNM